MPGRLEGKVAVVTGGAGGIGRETALRFAEEGARVCIADLVDEPGKETASEVDGIYVHADVTDPDDVQRMYTETAEHFGGIDVLFNNASFVAVMEAATSQISYTASKGGVLALSRELGVEFARRGIRVNALCPG